MSLKFKKFDNGKTYQNVYSVVSKNEAKRIAKRFRKDGYLVRVVKRRVASKDGGWNVHYDIYTRGK